MKTYTINIGRNNNQLADNHEVLSTFRSIMDLSSMKLGRVNCIRDGEYKGAEPTFVAEFEANNTFEVFTLLGLCNMIYTQECIAVSSNDKEWNRLEYHHSFKGDKMEFNYDYFLWIEEKEV